MSALAQPREPRTGWLVAGAAAAAVGCGAAAVASPPLGLAASLALLFTAVAFSSLPLGLALFAGLTFFERLPVAVAGPIPLSKIALLVLVLAALRRSGAPLLFRERPLLAGTAVLFSAWAAASLLWAVDSAAAAAEALRLASGVAIVFVVFAALRERRHVRWLVSGYTAGASLTVVAGLAGLGAEPIADAPGRLVGGVGDPNILAAVVVPALPMAGFALGTVRSAQARFLLLASLVVVTFGVLLTQSRGGVIALGAALVLAALLGGRFRPHVLVVVFAASALFLAYWAVVATPDARDRITNITSGGGTGRLDIWTVAGQAFSDHPLAGVGAGNFTAVEPVYASDTINLPHVRFVLDEPRVVHNTFLEIPTELGVVGLVAFAALLLQALLHGRTAVAAFARTRDVELELLSRGALVGMLSMLVAFVFISGQAKEQLWLLVGLLVALPSLTPAAGRAPAFGARVAGG